MTMPVNSEIKLLGRNNSGTLFTYIYMIIKLFVLVAFGGGLLFGIFQSVKIHSINGFTDGIMFGAMLAATMVPILIILDIIQKVKCYLKYKVIDFEINQERKFILTSDYAFIFNKICEQLNNQKNIKIHKKEIESGIIEAVTKSSWKSFGEIIKIKLFKSTSGNIVVLSSKPKISITMIDYCRNLENVENIMKDIKKLGLSLS